MDRSLTKPAIWGTIFTLKSKLFRSAGFPSGQRRTNSFVYLSLLSYLQVATVDIIPPICLPVAVK
jgi:hypothetical protein